MLQTHPCLRTRTDKEQRTQEANTAKATAAAAQVAAASKGGGQHDATGQSAAAASKVEETLMLRKCAPLYAYQKGSSCRTGVATRYENRMFKSKFRATYNFRIISACLMILLCSITVPMDFPPHARRQRRNRQNRLLGFSRYQSLAVAGEKGDVATRHPPAKGPNRPSLNLSENDNGPVQMLLTVRVRCET